MARAEPAGNVADLLRAAASMHAGRPALVRVEDSRTWDELDAAVDAGAGALQGAGLPTGGRVLIALPNGPDLVLAVFAVLRAGGVAVPVDPTRADVSDIAGRLDVVGAIIVGDEDRNDDAAGPASVRITDGVVTQWWNRAGTVPPPIAPPAQAGGEQVAVIGRASSADAAVLLSHRALLAAARAVDEMPVMQAVDRDRVLLTQPLFHATTFAGVFLPVVALGSAVVFPAAPGATAALEACRELGITILSGGPGIYHTIRKNAAAAESLAGVRLMTSASAPLEAADFTGILEVTGKPVWEGYASSETSGVACSSLITDQARPGSVGRPLPGVEVRIVDESSTVVTEANVTEPGNTEPGSTEPGSTEPCSTEPGDTEPGDAEPNSDADPAPAAPTPVSRDDMFAELDSEDFGFIEVRGPTLFSGYWPDGAGGPADDGWFRTPDLGYFDDAGELRLVDRAREAIKVAGFTVYPREIEQALDDHPYVADVAVVGVPGARGEDVVAVIAVRPGTRPSDAELAEFAAQRLASFKRPVKYRLVKTLPRNEVGRLDRAAARAEYAAFAGIDLSVASVTGIQDIGDRAADSAGPADADTAAESTDASPEEAADLGELGARLPAAGSRTQRYRQDTDEDLFGDEVG